MSDPIVQNALKTLSEPKTREEVTRSVAELERSGILDRNQRGIRYQVMKTIANPLALTFRTLDDVPRELAVQIAHLILIRVQDEDAIQLSKLKSVKSLVLPSNITDAQFRHLLPGVLEDVTLSGCVELSSASFQRFSDFHALKKLDIGNTHVCDYDLRSLVELPLLEELSLRECKRVTDMGVAMLEGIPGLKKLWIQGTNITLRGVELLKGSTNI